MLDPVVQLQILDFCGTKNTDKQQTKTQPINFLSQTKIKITNNLASGNVIYVMLCNAVSIWLFGVKNTKFPTSAYLRDITQGRKYLTFCENLT